MATALPSPDQPERDIPLTQIPATIRDLRQSWATQYTRAEQLERELAEARQKAEDWQAIAIENGERAAQLNVTLARMQIAAEEARAEIERLGDQLRVEIRQRQKADREACRNEAAFETLCELLKNNAVGRDCDTCDGTGEVSDIEPVHCGGPTNAYFERTVIDECGDCFAGRVAR